MNTIQDIFNNREIAIGLWVIVAVILLLFTKAAREFLKTALPILFCKKFVVFYIVFLSYLAVVLYVLNWAEWWDLELLKDTIFWVLFVELAAYENLLTTWEQETIRYLQLSAMTVSDDFGIKPENADKYTKAHFCDYYSNKVKTAPQNEKINTYTYSVKTDIEKYSTRVKQFCEDFKYCY